MRGVTARRAVYFFSSQSRFRYLPHSYASIEEILSTLGVNRKEYNDEGLIVLRSVIMNPFYDAANHKMDYLSEFVKHLHRTAREVFNPDADKIRSLR